MSVGSGSSKISSAEKIVFLDAGTVDYGDLSLSPLKKCGTLKTYFQSRPSQIAARARGAAHIITNKCPIDAGILASLKSVKGIHLSATGTNIIDLAAARRAGIGVTNVRNYCTDSIVQFTMGFIMMLAGHIREYDQAVRDGRWSRSPFFMYAGLPIREVKGKTLGIIGLGNIGRGVAKAARAFGIKVIAAKIPGRTYPKTEMARLPFAQVLRQADFLTIHAPLTDLTRDLINAKVIRMMKKGAFLINMARGGIVNEKALAAALKSGHLAGAALDVLTQEPPSRKHLLMKAPNLLMTPHASWASLESRTRLIDEVALNIRAFQTGRKRNRIL